MGIKAPVTLSNSIQYAKRHRDLREVKRGQRRLARVVQGANGRRKMRPWLAKAGQRVQERAHGALHELTAALVKPHSSRFLVEDLQSKNLVTNGHLARAIHDQQWGSLVH